MTCLPQETTREFSCRPAHGTAGANKVERNVVVQGSVRDRDQTAASNRCIGKRWPGQCNTDTLYTSIDYKIVIFEAAVLAAGQILDGFDGKPTTPALDVRIMQEGHGEKRLRVAIRL